MFATVFVLLPRMASVGTVLLLLYYFFAIIGMESFFETANEDTLTDCCNDTNVVGNVVGSFKNGTG